MFERGFYRPSVFLGNQLKIRIIHLKPDAGSSFFALEQSRLFRRSLHFCNAWSDGGDLVKFPNQLQAEATKILIPKKSANWQVFDLEAFGYKKC